MGSAVDLGKGLQTQYASNEIELGIGEMEDVFEGGTDYVSWIKNKGLLLFSSPSKKY